MTRVLIVEPAGNLWGSERALLEFVARMPNIESAVCCPPHAPLIPELQKLSIRVFPYFIYALHEKSRLKRFWAAIELIRACFQFRPEAIYLNQSGCYRIALPAAAFFGLPIVAHVRIFDDVTYFADRHPNPHRLRGIVATSYAVAKALQCQPALSAISQYVCYDSYLPKALVNKSSPATRIPTRIACVGRIVPTKGQYLLIDAMHWLAKNGGTADCCMVGDGPRDFLELLRKAGESGPGATLIHWLGVLDDVVSLLETCAVLVCPSQKESLGRVILEAWDAGAVPVACETSGGAAEIIAAANGGILYAEQTPEALAKALLEAIQLPHEEVTRLIENGRLWMHRHCDPTAYGEAVARILQDAIDRHSGQIRCA
jgi:glycosyltransferase involved in cell wall biosynthesis